METHQKSPYVELNEWLNGFPDSERDKLSAKALISLKRDYEPELDLDNPESLPKDIQEFLDDLVIDDEVTRQWDETLNSPESIAMLEKMAAEAEQERENGHVYTLKDLEKILEVNLARERRNAES